MGRIKTQQIKRITHKLIEKHRDLLTDSYEGNKQVIGKLLDPSPKKLRNIIAGYATRIVKMGKTEV